MSESLERTVDFSAVIEGAYGTGTPETTAFTKAWWIFGAGSIHQTDTESRNLNPLSRSLSSRGEAIGRELQKFNPGTMLMGHGGDPANWFLKSLLQMAGFACTDDVPNSRTDAVYRSSGFESGACSSYHDAVDGSGLLYRAVGCVATFSMSGRAGEEIAITTDIQGKTFDVANDPIVQAAPTVTYPTGGSIVHTMENEGLTITVTGGSGAFTPVWRSFNLVAGWTISERRDANSPKGLKGLRLTKRAPTLQLVIEQDTDFLPELKASIRAGASMYSAVHFIHGPGNGEQVEVSAILQAKNVTDSGDADLTVNTIEYALIDPAASDGELTISAI